MISPISFAGTTAPAQKTFNDIINQPQAYKKEQPNAATGIGKEKKKSSIGKTILKTAGIIAGIMAALAIGHKTGIFEKALSAIEKINNAQIKSALTFVMSLPEKAGKKICDWGSKLFSVFSKKSAELGETIGAQASQAGETLQGTAEKVVGAGQDVASQAAEMAEKAAETLS